MVEKHEQQEARRGAWIEQRVEIEAWEAQHRGEWERVDQKLRGVAKRRAALDAEEAGLLRYAEELKLWRAFGYGSMLEYLERALGYAPRTALERLRVARVLVELPLVAEALENGALAHSAVRELSRVATPETEAVWLEAAGGKSLREIESMVSGHKPGDLPEDPTEPRLQKRTITLEVSPETYDLWRRLHALAAEEHGQRLDDDELISSLYRRAYSAEPQSSSPAYQIAIKQCPDCKRAFQYSGGRDIEVDPAIAERAVCDAVHLGSLDAEIPERATTTVTPRKRTQVLARDGHACVVPGCRRNVGLDLHHIEYQSHGGSHALQNLASVCDLHHAAIHLGKLEIRGTAPDHLSFVFRGARARRTITDDAPLPAAIGAAAAATGHVHVGATLRPPDASDPPPRHPAIRESRAHRTVADNASIEAPLPAAVGAAEAEIDHVHVGATRGTLEETGTPPLHLASTFHGARVRRNITDDATVDAPLPAAIGAVAAEAGHVHVGATRGTLEETGTPPLHLTSTFRGARTHRTVDDASVDEPYSAAVGAAAAEGSVHVG